MDALVKVVQDLSKVKSRDDVIQIVRTAARQTVGAEGATFVLREGEFCFYVEEDAIGPLWKGRRFPISACVSGWAMLNRRPVAIPDIFHDPRVPIAAYEPTFVKSLAMMPIRRSDPIGAIGVYWAKEHQATEEELEVLQAIADTTSVALEHVQLIDTLEKRVQELENVGRAKDEFLMMVSHELRTPLTSILGWSEVLTKASDQIDTPKLKIGLDSIHRNSKGQLQVIDGLLDASSIVLGKFEINSRPVDLLPIVKKEVASEFELAKRKNVTVKFISSLDHAPMSGDEARLHQVVNALIDNAIKFSKNDGVVEVRLENEGPSLSLSVLDFGAGIALDDQSDLFTRFSQKEPVLTRTHGGLGLGLTIAKSIVNSHHGQITVRSLGLGKGSEFRVNFPKSYYPDGRTEKK